MLHFLGSFAERLTPHPEVILHMLADVTIDNPDDYPQDYGRLREISHAAQHAMQQRYMAYLASAEEADEDFSDFGDEARRVWGQAQSGLEGVVRLGYKRHRNLAYADEPLDLQLAAATYLTNALIAAGKNDLQAATTAFYVCISRGSKDKRKALEEDVPFHKMHEEPAMTLYDILSGMRSGTLLSEIGRRFHRMWCRDASGGCDFRADVAVWDDIQGSHSHRSRPV